MVGPQAQRQRGGVVDVLGLVPVPDLDPVGGEAGRDQEGTLLREPLEAGPQLVGLHPAARERHRDVPQGQLGVRRLRADVLRHTHPVPEHCRPQLLHGPSLVQRRRSTRSSRWTSSRSYPAPNVLASSRVDLPSRSGTSVEE